MRLPSRLSGYEYRAPKGDGIIAGLMLGDDGICLRRHNSADSERRGNAQFGV
jgi:hypothetical protein